MQRYLQEEDNKEISQQRMELCCYLQLLTSYGLVRRICQISRHECVQQNVQIHSGSSQRLQTQL